MGKKIHQSQKKIKKFAESHGRKHRSQSNRRYCSCLFVVWWSSSSRRPKGGGNYPSKAKSKPSRPCLAKCLDSTAAFRPAFYRSAPMRRERNKDRERERDIEKERKSERGTRERDKERKERMSKAKRREEKD